MIGVVANLGELGVGETEGPETQVGRGVGDGAEDELDCLDALLDDDLVDLEVLFLLEFPVLHEAPGVLLLAFQGVVLLRVHLQGLLDQLLVVRRDSPPVRHLVLDHLAQRLGWAIVR